MAVEAEEVRRANPLEEEPGLGLDQTLQDALQSIREHLNMDVAFISEFKHGHRIFRHVDSAGPLSVGPNDSGPLESSYCQRLIDGRLPKIIEDSSTLLESAKLKITRELGIKSYLGVPICLPSGALYGTICCFTTRTTVKLGESDLAVLNVFADFVGRQLERACERTAQVRQCRKAVVQILQDRTFNSVFQPIVDITGDDTIGYEALTRFSGQTRRSPAQWFADAHEAGLRVELEQATLRRALDSFHRLPHSAYLSLNVSPETLLRADFGAMLDSTVSGSVPFDRITLEITEHAHIDDYLNVQRALKPLRDRGVRIAVDDAGAGHSSFRHILIIKPDIIKLDKSIIRNVHRRLESRALCASLIRFAEEVGCEIIAEGVETTTELATLQSLGVRYVQGYLTGRPMNLEKIAE